MGFLDDLFDGGEKSSNAWGTALGVGGSLLGAYLGSQSAKKAAKTQKKATQQANQALESRYQQARKDQLPWMQQGQAAVNQLGYLMGLGGFNPGAARQDTIPAMINPQEAQTLKAMGGAGVRNPETGFYHFYNDPMGDSSDPESSNYGGDSDSRERKGGNYDSREARRASYGVRDPNTRYKGFKESGFDFSRDEGSYTMEPHRFVDRLGKFIKGAKTAGALVGGVASGNPAAIVSGAKGIPEMMDNLRYAFNDRTYNVDQGGWGGSVSGGWGGFRGASLPAGEDGMFDPTRAAGDTVRAQLSPWQAYMLQARGGSGVQNPYTGYYHFYPETDWTKYYNKNVAPTGAYGGRSWDGLTDPERRAAMTPGAPSGIQGGYGSFMRDFGMSDFQADPGAQFRSDQANQALERRASARGTLGGGGFIKDLAALNQGLASQEYQSAYDRYMNNRGTKFNMLSTLAGLGQGSAGNVGGYGMNTGANTASNLMNLGAGQSASNLAQGNAWQGGINNAMNLWNQYLYS